MNDYINKYRVLIERDSDGEPLENGFTYLKCVNRNKGGKVYRINKDVLSAYIIGTGKSNNIIEEIKGIGVEIIKVVEYNGEKDIHFKECDLDKIKDIVCLTESGAKISGASIKNHPRYKEIKQERYDALSDEEKEKRRLSGERLQGLLGSKEE